MLETTQIPSLHWTSKL